MDAILESNLLTTMGPYGIAVLALVAVYFLWQRQTQQFSDLKDAMNKVIEGVQKSDSEQRGALQTITSQNSAFQLEIASSRPTRKEMNESFDRMAQMFRDVMQPVRDDVQEIKKFILERGIK